MRAYILLAQQGLRRVSNCAELGDSQEQRPSPARAEDVLQECGRDGDGEGSSSVRQPTQRATAYDFWPTLNLLTTTVSGV